MERAKDISATIAAFLCGFAILFGGVSGFLSFNELENKSAAEGGVRKKNDELKGKHKTAADALAKVVERLRKLCVPMGFRDQSLRKVEGTKAPAEMVKSISDPSKDQPAHVILDRTQLNPIVRSLKQSLAELKSYNERYPDALKDFPVGTYTDLEYNNTSYRTVQAEHLTVEKSIAAYERLHSYLQGKLDAALKERDDQRGSELKVVGENIGSPTAKEGDQAKMEKDLNGQADAKRGENDEISKRIKVQAQEKEAEIASNDRDIKAKLEKRDQTIAEHVAAVAKIEKAILDMKGRIDKIIQREELARASQEFDGRLTHVVPEQAYAYIDLGTINTLLKGTRFKVFGTLKGGKKVEKGEVEVTNVYDNYAQVAILTQLNPAYPLSTGDFINNEVFDPKKAKTFCFAGRFVGKYSNEDAKFKIEEIGGHVVSEVSLDTTYLVVGDGYLTSPNYQKATELGVLVIREKDLYELLGIH
ncbi:MAG: BRCT domain-containing protein [Planctomycetes bacterium]|nr:BRCT domain-containing protein [Planctomycetota bacterium]